MDIVTRQRCRCWHSLVERTARSRPEWRAHWLGVTGLLVLFASPVHAGAHQITASRDSYLEEARPVLNFGSQSKFGVKEKSGDSKRAVYYFDLSAIPTGETVEAAYLRLFVDMSAGSAVAVHRITDSWTESAVDWNNTSADFDPIPRASFTPSSQGVYLTIDITMLVQEWRSGTGNHGVMLISKSTDEESRYFSREWTTESQRPRLDITTVPNIATSKVSEVLRDTVNGTANPKLIPGATVRSTLVVTNRGVVSASNVIVTDPVPSSMTYAAGSLKLATASLSDASDADAGAYDSGTGTVTVNVGNLAANGGSATIMLEATIN